MAASAVPKVAKSIGNTIASQRLKHDTQNMRTGLTVRTRGLDGGVIGKIANIVDNSKL